MFEVMVCSLKGDRLARFDLSRLGAAGGGAGRAVVGRAEDCDIRIKSAAVSRHHCAIDVDEGDWVIRDLGSTHGTIVEGIQISEAAVVAGLEVRVGPAVLRFAAVESPAAGVSIRAGWFGSGRFGSGRFGRGVLKGAGG